MEPLSHDRKCERFWTLPEDWERREELERGIAVQKKAAQKLDEEYGTFAEIRQRQVEADENVRRLKTEQTRNAEFLTQLSRIQNGDKDDTARDAELAQLMHDYPEIAEKVQAQPGVADMTTEEIIEQAQTTVQAEQEAVAEDVKTAEAEMEKLNVPVPEDTISSNASKLSNEDTHEIAAKNDEFARDIFSTMDIKLGA